MAAWCRPASVARLAISSVVIVGAFACSEPFSSRLVGPTTPPPDALAGTPGATLVVRSFTVVEYQYPGLPDRWSYGPEVEVEETGGVATATVIQVSLEIDGLGHAPPAFFRRCVGPGERRPLFRPIYGDFEMSIEGSHRASGPNATIEITYIDPDGRQGSVRQTGPIVSGRLPDYDAQGPVSSCGG